MAKWLGPGVLTLGRTKNDKPVVIAPGKEFDESRLDKGRVDSLKKKGFIESKMSIKADDKKADGAK